MSVAQWGELILQAQHPQESPATVLAQGEPTPVTGGLRALGEPALGERAQAVGWLRALVPVPALPVPALLLLLLLQRLARGRPLPEQSLWGCLRWPLLKRVPAEAREALGRARAQRRSREGGVRPDRPHSQAPHRDRGSLDH